MKTWFITGGTPGGFGMAYANAALAIGDRVALTARRPDELAEWAQQHGDRVLVLPLDVTDREQIRRAVRAAEERFGGIDVLVNNAGRGWYGSVEGSTDDTVRRTFDLNFFGAVDVIRAVLPGMRERGSGWIVSMSSLAGLVGITGFGYYSAAKFALEGLTEALRREVEPFGVKVLSVEPGAFRTNAYAGFDDEPISETVDAYHPLLTEVRAAFVAENGKQAGDPDRGVRAVIEAMNSANPPERLVLGNAAFESATTKFEATLTELRVHEKLSRGADFD
ncbi:oxidoreductase [Kutzneria sp. CA-103260]|uniref:oxidoreductase n=1 Tax=Kutzneria sp. CA-103260 TaxID=2802641 RepID=UPI001BA4F90E|nr:oxidoreductase [Kutzneria sp. CA-103260]QUQ65919.1 short-chain dehydrogenase/reductase SDR [Kutzneria sp. CA-103260]